MEKNCLACHAALSGKQRKWCSPRCAVRASYNKRNGKAVSERSWIPTQTCSHCDSPVTNRAAQSRYCSNRCRLDAQHIVWTAKVQQQRKANGKPLRNELVPCGNPLCKELASYRGGQAYCSDRCQNRAAYFRKKSITPAGPFCPVYISGCPDCGVLITRKSKAPVRCQPCSQIANRAIDARKNHKRRAAGRIDVTIRDLSDRDGQRCHLCRRKIDLTLPGSAKWGATIDHILPVSFGGTNEAHNLALAHRHCNVARGNREPAQMLLTA